MATILSELVEKYAGRYVAVASCSVATAGNSLGEVRDAARKAFSHDEDFICALLSV